MRPSAARGPHSLTTIAGLSDVAKLTARTRAKLPAKDFAGPGKSFPIPDKNHARAALSGASRAERAGNISAAEKKRIDAKADAKLKRK